MTTMIDRSVRYESGSAFFELNGNAVMKLSPEAAIEVCGSAALNGRVVARIEGGLMDATGFEARYDCIWDGRDPPLHQHDAIANNHEAAAFIRLKSATHNAFIITAPPISGWPHKRQVAQQG